MKIDRLEITNLSGITKQLQLELGKKSLLLYGENGTGKSSLVEAMEYLLGGRVENLPPPKKPSFDPRIRNLALADQDTCVSAVFSNGKTLSRVNGELAKTEPTLEEWLTKLQGQEFVLRRKALLDFIEATAGDRYKIVRHWLQLDSLDIALKRLKSCVKFAQERIKSEVACFSSNAITTQFAGLPTPTTFEDASAHFQEDFETCELTVPKVFDDLSKAKQKLSESSPEPSISQDCLRTVEAWASGVPSELEQKVLKLRELRAQVTATRSELSAHENELDFLRNAASLLNTRTENEACPLCSQAVNIEELQRSVHQRMERLERLQTAEQSLRLARRECDQEVSRWNRAWASLDSDEFASTRSGVFEYLGELESGRVYDHHHCSQLLIGLTEKAEQSKNRQNQARQRLMNALTILSQWPDYVSRKERVSHANALHDRAKALYQMAQKSRNSIIQEKLDDITKPVREFYEALHPGERVEEIKLILPPPTPGGRKDETAEIKFTFDGQIAEDPRVHLSDGHLDTLGLAFFLMNLERKASSIKSSPKLLILDDVISSVDATHRTRFTRELLERFKTWQLIVTTHDKIWFKHLSQIGRNQGHQFKECLIRRWCSVNGPDLRDLKERFDYLTALLEEGGEPSILVGQSGILLEELFDGVRQDFGFSIPSRRDDKYDLRALYDSFKSSVKKKIKGWYVIAEHAQLIENLDNLLKSGTNIRNVLGAHFNRDAEHVTETEADEFTKTALALYRSFVCSAPGCRRPVQPTSDDLARCRCGELSYTKPAK